MSTLFTVAKKELQDYFNGWRCVLTFLLIIASIVYAFFAIGSMKNTMTGAIPTTGTYISLSVFTTQAFNISTSLIPTNVLSLLAILVPIMGIILGMDAINGEKNNGTLSRLISQPIYRDNIINAKFLSGITVIAITLTSTTLLVMGLGLLKLGVPPSSEEILRLLIFLVFGIIYGGFWLGLAILFSTLFRQVALSAIITIAIWIFFAFFFPLIYQSISANIQNVADAQRTVAVARISPMYLFNEAMAVILYPQTRSVSQILMLISTDASNYLLVTPLSVWQSFIAVWPQIIVTAFLTIICFVGSYLKFMFEEIRSI